MERKALQVVTGIIVLFAGALHGEEEWRLARAEQDIEVSTRAVEGSPIAETRGVMKLEGVTLKAAVALIADVPHQHEWIDSMDESRVLVAISPVEQINYTLSKAPWPVADRDAVVRSRFTFDKEKGVARVETHAEPDYIPRRDGVVRIRKVDSSWTVTRLSDDEIEVRYQVHSEPGGNLPAWLVNRIIYDQPFATLLNLREQVKQAKYRDAQLNDVDGVAVE